MDPCQIALMLAMLLSVAALWAGALADPRTRYPTDADDTIWWTTNQGAPVFDNDHSLTVGRRGPILLEDYHLLEKLANFDRERIPERVVHARGAAAKGVFTSTADISNITMADFLKFGKRTPVAVRFSTVIHERGSPETIRDPRGFAVKFYTEQGNYDMVGNNMPVFFIRDGMKFVDMVHALKPNPVNRIQENWRIADFFLYVPESLHMFSFLFDDIGIPKDYRHMDGFGVHTFKFITADKTGCVTSELYVKFHWKSQQGVESLTDEEAVLIGGKQHSHATKDLFDAIERGDFPKWDLHIQLMDPEKEDMYEFDPLDVTKIWPEDRFPLMKIGEMVLNQNPDNFYNDNEQIAFCPAVIVPGIYYSDDKMLQTRIFSYADTQRYRLGSNYLLLPINAPKCPYHNNHHDGQMNFMHRESEVNYFPSRYAPQRNAERYGIPQINVSGKRVKQVIGKENNFLQPGVRYRSFDADRQARFISRLVDFLADPKVTPEVRDIWIANWKQADESLAARLKSDLAMAVNGTR